MELSQWVADFKRAVRIALDDGPGPKSFEFIKARVPECSNAFLYVMLNESNDFNQIIPNFYQNNK